MSQAYSPDQRNVLPATRCTPSASILRDFQNSNSDSGKSSPTTPTSRTGEKKLTLSAAYDADPPNKSACSSTGVLTVSSAMEPTTRTDILDFRFQICDFRFGRKKRFDLLRILCDVCSFEQTGNDHDALRARGDYLIKILHLDAADAKDRQANIAVDFRNIRQADRLIIRLRRRGKERSETDVIRAFLLRRTSLFEAVGRFADNDRTSGYFARAGNGFVVLPDMHPFERHPPGQFSV